MSSQFKANKKTRRRYTKKAKQQLTWVAEQELPGGKPGWVIESMRKLAEFNLRMAKRRRKKRS
jgi:hypothetical protein